MSVLCRPTVTFIGEGEYYQTGPGDHTPFLSGYANSLGNSGGDH